MCLLFVERVPDFCESYGMIRDRASGKAEDVLACELWVLSRVDYITDVMLT